MPAKRVPDLSHLSRLVSEKLIHHGLQRKAGQLSREQLIAANSAALSELTEGLPESQWQNVLKRAKALKYSDTRRHGKLEELQQSFQRGTLWKLTDAQKKAIVKRYGKIPVSKHKVEILLPFVEKILRVLKRQNTAWENWFETVGVGKNYDRSLEEHWNLEVRRLMRDTKNAKSKVFQIFSKMIESKENPALIKIEDLELKKLYWELIAEFEDAIRAKPEK